MLRRLILSPVVHRAVRRSSTVEIPPPIPPPSSAYVRVGTGACVVTMIHEGYQQAVVAAHRYSYSPTVNLGTLVSEGIMGALTIGLLRGMVVGATWPISLPFYIIVAVADNYEIENPAYKK